MANEQGKDWRLFIKSGNGYIPVGGETTLSMKRASEKQDASDKDSGVYGASVYGQQTVSFSLGGNLKLPDPGFTALEAASKLSPPNIEAQLQRGGVVKYDGELSIGNFSAEFPAKGLATWSCDMDNAAAPTVDNLSATA
jgi:hypothetical protein